MSTRSSPARRALADVFSYGLLLLSFPTVTGCGPSLRAGASIDDPMLIELLRPSTGLRHERLVRTTEGEGYYAAELDRLPGPGFRGDYLHELETRGVCVLPDVGPGPDSPARHIARYQVRAVSEARLHPYTIRYRVGWLGEPGGDAPSVGDFPDPLVITGRWVVLRLPRAFFLPWAEAVVIPEVSPVSLPFAFPLPDAAVVVEAANRYAAGEAKGGETALPVAFDIRFLARMTMSEVAEFYGGVFEGKGSMTKTDATFVVRFSHTPNWAPHRTDLVQVREKSSLLHVPDGFQVLARPHVVPRQRKSHLSDAIQSLRNLPRDVRAYDVVLAYSSR